MNRFLIPEYIIHSLRIKLKAKLLSIKYGNYPYAHKKGLVQPSSIPSVELKYSERYLSFDYFSLAFARRHYRGNDALIVEAMLYLIEYNEKLEREEIDPSHMKAQAESLMKKARYIEGLPHFIVDEDAAKFDLKGKVISGIVQAKVASFFMRVYDHTQDDRYKKWARSSILTFLLPQNRGGVFFSNEYVKSWVEEYNTERPSMVLNGFIFCLIAAAEYVCHEEDYMIRRFLEEGLQALISWWPLFLEGDDILYSMYHWDISNVNYIGVLKYQIQHLNHLVAVKELKGILKKLEGHRSIPLFHRIMR